MAQGRSLGFGFLVGAKDEGATRTTTEVAEGFGGIATNIAATVRESAGLQRFGNMINALSLNRLNQISEGLEGLAERAGALTGEVTSTSLESFGAEFGQTYRAATAGLGVFQDAVDEVRGEISGLSFNLGVDATEMTNYAATVARTGRNVEDFGINMRDVAGSIQAGILSGQDLANVLTGLSEGYDLGDEGARQLLDRVTAIGERFGSGADAARALPDVMTAIDAAAARFPDIGANVDTATESIIRLGLAEQQRLGGTFQEGVQNAIEVFNNLAETRQGMEGLVAGLNTEIPDLATKLAEIGGMDMSMDAIMQDPARFAATMATMYQDLEPGSAAAIRIRDALSSMGPSFMFLIEGGERSQQALSAAMESVEGTEGAFSSMARAASGSTRTFAESMELLEESFRSRVDRMARQHYPRFEQQVLTRQREAYDRLQERIESFTARQGPLGALGRSFLALRRGGVQGLIVALDTELSSTFPRLGSMIGDTLPIVADMGSGLLDMASNAFPALAAMQAMGIPISRLAGAFRLLVNPLVLVGGGLYLLIRYWDQIEPMLERGVVQLENFADTFKGWVDSIDWDKAGQGLVAGILQAFSSAGEAVEGQAGDGSLAGRIGNALGTIFRAAGRAARGAIRGMWTELVGWITEPDDVIGQVRRGSAAFGVTLGAAMVSPLRGPIMSAISGVTGMMGTALSGISGAYRGVLGGLTRLGGQGGARAGMRVAGRSALRAIPGIGAILGVLFDLPDIISSFNTGGIVSGLRTTFSSIMNGVLLGIPQAIESLTGTTIISDIFNRIFDLTAIEGVISSIQSGNYMRAAVEAMFGTGLGSIVQDYVKESFGYDLFGEIATGLEGIFGTVSQVVQDIAAAWMTHAAPAFESIIGAFGELRAIATDLWTNTFQPMWTELGGLIGTIVNDVMGMFLGQTDSVGESFESVSAAASIFGGIITTVINAAGPIMRWIIDAALPVFVTLFEVAAFQARIVVGVIRVIATVLGVVWQVMRPIVGLIVSWNRLLSQWPRLFTDFNGLVEDLSGFFRDLGISIGDFWHARVVPAFEYMGEAWSGIAAAIWSTAQSIFGAIGRFVGSIVDAIVGYFRFMWTTYEAIFTTVWNLGVRVFNAIADVASAAFDRIVQAISNVAERWRIAREMLSTGFELIGSKIREYFLRPVLEVRNNFTNMIDRLREGFLSVKIAVLEMYRAIFSRIGDISILPDSIQDTFRTASRGMDVMIAGSQRELTTLQNQRREGQQEIARMEAAAQAESARLQERLATQAAALANVGRAAASSADGARARVAATEDQPGPTEPRNRLARREAARAAAQAQRRGPQPVVIAGVDRRAAGALSPSVTVNAPPPGRRATTRGRGEDRSEVR